MKRVSRAECARWVVLLAVGAWLFGPFATSRQIGAGDALWYVQMLADFVTQSRAGVFPVFVGQTEYAFNGAVYPLRVAPAYQHLAGAIDVVTGQRLGFFALQHAVALFAAGVALGLTYLLLATLAPRHRWTAVALAILFATCPGVLGLLATQDLYMSWIASAAVPLVFFGVLRAWRHHDCLSTVALGTGVGVLWLAHAPIALWTTGVAGVLSGLWLIARLREPSAWKHALGSATLATLIGHFPFISLRLLDVPPGPATSGGLPRAEVILESLRMAFPQMVKPLTAQAAHLGDLQFGYGLWLVLFLIMAIALALRRWVWLTAGVVAGAMLVVLFPIPGFSSAFWLNLPAAVQRLTYYWPMQRLLPVTAGLVVVLAQVTLANESPPSRLARVVTSLIVLSAAWSLWEARQLRAAAEVRTASPAESELRLRPENLTLMNHAYGLFPALPATFSHGVVDPMQSARLLDPSTGEPLMYDASHRTVADGEFSGTLDANPGILNLAPGILLEPKRRYLLRFEFRSSQDYNGILQLIGDGFFRQYRLPNSGEPRAFGSAPGAAREIALWTTRTTSTEIQLRFIPDLPDVGVLSFQDFANFQFVETVSTPGVQIESLLPLHMTVDAPLAASLETPRVFLPHYQARINDTPVSARPSPDGLVMIPVPEGTSAVRLEYRAPMALYGSYFLMLVSVVGATASLMWLLIRQCCVNRTTLESEG